jgi:hypothetical protein
MLSVQYAPNSGPGEREPPSRVATTIPDGRENEVVIHGESG